MKKVYVNSAFIPVEGFFEIKKVDLKVVKELIKESDVIVSTQHQTVKVLGLSPEKERVNLTEEQLKGNIQIWVKPKIRLEFGKEYNLKEIEEIGYDIYIAYPME